MEPTVAHTPRLTHAAILGARRGVPSVRERATRRPAPELELSGSRKWHEYCRVPAMNKTRLWLSLASALLLAPSCSKSEGAACFAPSDCAEGLACVGEAVMRCEKCSDLTQCKAYGRCTAKDGVCLAASDAECKASYDCKERGPCTAKEGACVVGGDADCKQSEACAKDKYCLAKGNNCVMSEADKKVAAQARADAAAAAKKEWDKKAAEDAEQP